AVALLDSRDSDLDALVLVREVFGGDLLGVDGQRGIDRIDLVLVIGRLDAHGVGQGLRGHAGPLHLEGHVLLGSDDLSVLVRLQGQVRARTRGRRGACREVAAADGDLVALLEVGDSDSETVLGEVFGLDGLSRELQRSVELLGLVAVVTLVVIRGGRGGLGLGLLRLLVLLLIGGLVLGGFVLGRLLLGGLLLRCLVSGLLLGLRLLLLGFLLRRLLRSFLLSGSLLLGLLLGFGLFLLGLLSLRLLGLRLGGVGRLGGRGFRSGDRAGHESGECEGDCRCEDDLLHWSAFTLCRGGVMLALILGSVNFPNYFCTFCSGLTAVTFRRISVTVP